MLGLDLLIRAVRRRTTPRRSISYHIDSSLRPEVSAKVPSSSQLTPCFRETDMAADLEDLVHIDITHFS